MEESRTGPKFGHPTFNCNICSSFTQRTSQSCLNHSQGSCEWVDADFGVLWVESEQILHLKVGCPNFAVSKVQPFTLLWWSAKSQTGPELEQPTLKCNFCSYSTHRNPRSASNHSQGSCKWFKHDLEVMAVKLEKILQLKVGCSNLSPVQDFGHLPYLPI